MIRIIELPQVGESVTEGVIGKWLVEPGQHIEKYDPLVEVVTDKVSMEAPSPYTGVFVRALAEEGETVPMGQPICEMDVEGEESPVVPAEAGTSQPDAVIPAQAGIPGGHQATRAQAAHEAGSGDEGDEPSIAAPDDPLSLEGEGGGEGEPVQEADEAPAGEDPGRVGGAWAMPAAQGADAQGADAPESGQDEEAAQPAQPAFEFMDSVRSVGPTGSGERGEGRPDALQEQALAESAHETAAPSVAEPDRSHVISPLVARLSAQYGIDLSTIRGTGTGGRITSKDLLEAVSRMTSQTEEASAQAEPAPEEAAAEAAPEDEAEAASPVIPAPPPVVPAEAGTSQPVGSAQAAPEEPEEHAQAAEAEPLTEEAAAQPVADAEPPSPVIPASPPVVPAEAGTSQPVGDAWAAHEEVAEPAQATEVEQVAEEAAPEDVEEEEAVEEAAPAEPAAAETSVLPLTPVRRIIAEHMARSSREIPAAWSMVEVDATRLVRTRDALKAAFEEKHGVPLTYLPFAASAVAAALREHPRLNARWDDGHITLNNRVNLAVAVATEAGLMVPVLRDADTLSIAGIAAELRRLTGGARAGTLAIEDVQGGTFTLNNTGALGSVVSVPIINHPQAAIMTTEAIVKRPVVVEGDAIAVRSMMNLCLTFDHRVCDGAEAAAFLSAVKARLEVIDESIGLG